MNLLDTAVALLPAACYDRQFLKAAIDKALESLNFSCARGSQVLLKPNLVTAGGHDGLGCTHPEFIAAAAEWFIDHGARVTVGDSPAFDSARKVMAACGIDRALASLPVTLTDFGPGDPVRLACGVTVSIARQATECDLFVNLPRVKSHGQLLVTLAVKNHFGVVLGWRKPMLHMRLGDRDNRFPAMLVDLIRALPDGVSLIDGITAMQGDGPVSGSPFALKVLTAARNPIAADTALLEILGIDPFSSPVHRECLSRRLSGSLPEQLSFPLEKPRDLAASGFAPPSSISPIRFRPGHALTSAAKRFLLSLRQR